MFGNPAVQQYDGFVNLENWKIDSWQQKQEYGTTGIKISRTLIKTNQLTLLTYP